MTCVAAEECGAICVPHILSCARSKVCVESDECLCVSDVCVDTSVIHQLFE